MDNNSTSILNQGFALSATETDTASTDSTFFRDVFDSYHKRIYNYMRYRVSDLCEAEELTSQVFEKVLQKLSTFRPDRAPFEVWLFSIAHHTVNDYYRKQKRRQWFSLDSIKEMISGNWITEEKIMEKQMRLRSRFFTGKIAAAVAVITLVGATAFSEPLLAFANHATESISKIVQLGYTSVMQMDDQAPPVDKQNASLVQDSEKTLVTANDQPLEIDRAIYATLAEAQKTVSYKLLSPTYLPAGYSFKEASGFKGEGADVGTGRCQLLLVLQRLWKR
nr:RNA polymerase sigma factor [uncultured Brevibacillus sp.]